ncbi:amidohydrolase family protein [Candidatus Bathyarchaeota archaeon]|nr:amidohydrolase family protein [Candidatus Bathyarchaeota archaeon]
MADILIRNGTVITMDPSRRVITDGAVAVEKDRIVDVGETGELVKRHSADRVIDADKMVVMPSLMDGHSHAGHSLLRSLGMHNETWYEACNRIYAEGSTEQFWAADAQLLNLERLKFGTTCGVTFLGGGDSVMRSNDPVYAERHCDAIEKIGVKAFLAVGPRRPPFPSKYASWSGESKTEHMVSFENQIETCSKVIKANHGRAGGRVNIAMMFPTPHPEVKPITGAELERLKYMSGAAYGLAESHGLMFTMDGHTRGTVKFCHEELGIAGQRSLFSHSTDLTEEEIRICAETGTKIAHNPSAVASMTARCPVPELIDAGVTVALGSDAGAPDRSFDMFRHMFVAMRYHRRHFRDSRVLPPGKTLEMTTIDGAKAFRLEDQVGSLEPGKKADIILLDMRKPHLYPLNMPVDRVTYFANGSDVDTVIVDGEILMEGREVKTVDEAEVLDVAQQEIEAAVGRSGLNSLLDTPDGYWGRSRY